jgi:hypothetical protein
MGDIYRLSYLTLYALSSPDCGHGMLVQRHDLASAETPSLNNAHSLEKTRAHVFRTAPLFQRAWALQERLLSPRLLYYSDGETFWECLAHTAREGNHRIIPHKPTPYRYESYECPQVRIQLADHSVGILTLPSDLPFGQTARFVRVGIHVPKEHRLHLRCRHVDRKPSR